MKILHTGDWHIGQNFYGYERMEEHRSFFKQLKAIVSREKPDAMVVCGDIFHNYSPSAEAQRLYTESLVSIHNVLPEMRIIVTAGNHDSASRLEVDNDLWQLANVSVVGRLRYNDGGIDFAKHLFRIGDKGYVMALPYIFDQSYPADPEGKDNRKYFFSLVDEYVRSANKEGLPTVLMAHISVKGSELKGQRIRGAEDSVGGIDYISSEDLGSAFDYVALGHIHHAQTIPGTHNRIRYAGSPIPISFDEDYPHSVTIVNIEPGKEPQINFNDFVIDNPYPLLTVPKEPMKTEQAIAQLWNDVPEHGKCYVRLNPEECHMFPATMEDDTVNVLQQINPEACYTTFVPNLTKGETSKMTQRDITPDQLVKMDSIEVARDYFGMLDYDFDEYKELFNKVIERIKREEAE